jgi:DNA-binding beta-propeller fold protein YncE
VDRVASEIVVFNSNRFTVLDRIPLPDPTALAMSPNLDFLAVTNEGADQVSFIDVNPGSATFHTVVKTTTVGTGPTGIAWDSCNEDIFVCNQGEGTVSVLSSFTLDVRKTLRNQITRPIDVALTPRQTTFGFSRGVYFGYILNQNGKVAVFESGPDGVNGIGFDDVIASLPFTFARPKAIQVDPSNLNSAVWICHETPLDETGQPTGQGGGALSNVGIAGGTIGTIPLDVGVFGNPQIRDLQFGVFASIAEGPNGLTGIPVDLALDNMRNLSALTNFATQFSPGFPLSYNGKSVVKLLTGAPLSGTAPTFLFAAVPSEGVVDVFSMASSAFDKVDTDVFSDGANPIPAPNVTVLMDYFRQ